MKARVSRGRVKVHGLFFSLFRLAPLFLRCHFFQEYFQCLPSCTRSRFHEVEGCLCRRPSVVRAICVRELHQSGRGARPAGYHWPLSRYLYHNPSSPSTYISLTLALRRSSSNFHTRSCSTRLRRSIAIANLVCPLSARPHFLFHPSVFCDIYHPTLISTHL